MAYAALASAPLLTALLPFNTATLILSWVAHALPVGGLMTLAFGASMGSGRLAWRLAGVFAACAYLAIWPTLAGAVRHPADVRLLTAYTICIVPYVLVAFIMLAMFAVLRPHLQLIWEVAAKEVGVGTRLRFSVFHLLVLMAFTAVVLSLMRGARGSGPAERGIESWQWWAGHALFVVTFFANTTGAAWAALGTHNVARKCAAVILVSSLLGTAIAFSLRHHEVAWWFFAGGAATMVVPTLVVLASLLWLRPCGIRLTYRQVLTGTIR